MTSRHAMSLVPALTIQPSFMQVSKQVMQQDEQASSSNASIQALQAVRASDNSDDSPAATGVKSVSQRVVK